MPETLLPRININNSITSNITNSITNDVIKLSQSIDNSLIQSNTLVLHKKIFKQRDIQSPIKINTNDSPRSKSASNKNDEQLSNNNSNNNNNNKTLVTRLGLCTSPVTKRDAFEAVKTRQEALKHKDSFSLLQNSFVSKFNDISNDNNNNIINNIIQNNDNNGSLIIDNKRNINPLSLSLRQTAAEIQSYQESNKKKLNNFKKLELDIKSTVKPPRSGESFDEKQRKRDRLRAETYAINAYLKKIENSKWEKLKAEQTQADDISWCSDDSSVLPTPRYRTSSEKKKSSKNDSSNKNSNGSGSSSSTTKKIAPRTFGGV